MTYDEEFIARHTPVEESEEDYYTRLEYQAGCYSYDDENE